MTWSDREDARPQGAAAADLGAEGAATAHQPKAASSPHDTGAFLAAAEAEKSVGATAPASADAPAASGRALGLHSAPQHSQLPDALGARRAADEAHHSEDALFAAPAAVNAAGDTGAEGPIGLHAKAANEAAAAPAAAAPAPETAALKHGDPEDALFSPAGSADELPAAAVAAQARLQEALFSGTDHAADADGALFEQHEAHAPAAEAANTPAAGAPAPLPGQETLFAAGDSAPAPSPAPAPIQAATPDPSAVADPDADEDTAPIPDVSSVEDTAEIDVEAVEAKLNDPGSTLSFEPLPEERINTSSTYDAGTSTNLTWGARSDVGCVRSHNEDSYLVQPPLFCVSDGMGGHAAGEVASSIAVETIAKTAPAAADPALLGAAVESANAAVIEAAANGRGKPGMGCTATVAMIEGHTLAIAHVGDSRAYLLHGGMLIRITHDHSLVEELVDAGEITADEARVHPNRSVITRALGSDPAMYADHFTLNIEKGDRLILCSDGLSGMIPDRDIESIATESSSAQLAADNLVDAALAAGGTDNVTVVVVDVMDDGRMKELHRRRRRNLIIAGVAALVLVLATVAALAISISSSVYLGIKDGNVAVYRGIPSTPLGIELHWLEDETSVEVDQLPEDTQSRLGQGIPQGSTEEAERTVANYRDQIDSQRAREALTAQSLQEQHDPAAADEADTQDGADAENSADASAGADAASTDQTPENTGGAA